MNLESIIIYIRNHVGELVFVAIIIFAILFFGDTIGDFFRRTPKPTVIQNTGKKANYEPDISFLECLGAQHSCVYDNIRTGNEKFIIENCKEEEFCTLGKLITDQGKRK